MSMINPESNIIIIIIIIIIILHYHPIMSILSRTTITNVLQSPHDHCAAFYPRRPKSLKRRWIENTKSISLYNHTDIVCIASALVVVVMLQT